MNRHAEAAECAASNPIDGARGILSIHCSRCFVLTAEYHRLGFYSSASTMKSSCSETFIIHKMFMPITDDKSSMHERRAPQRTVRGAQRVPENKKVNKKGAVSMTGLLRGINTVGGTSRVWSYGADGARIATPADSRVARNRRANSTAWAPWRRPSRWPCARSRASHQHRPRATHKRCSPS
jgi:hypothetical protein